MISCRRKRSLDSDKNDHLNYRNQGDHDLANKIWIITSLIWSRAKILIKKKFKTLAHEKKKRIKNKMSDDLLFHWYWSFSGPCLSSNITDTGEDSKLVHRRKCSKVNAAPPRYLLREFPSRPSDEYDSPPSRNYSRSLLNVFACIG